MKKVLIALLIIGVVSTVAFATVRNINVQSEIVNGLKRIRAQRLSCRQSADASITEMNNWKDNYSSEVDSTDGSNLQTILTNLGTASSAENVIIGNIDTNFPSIQE